MIQRPRRKDWYRLIEGVGKSRVLIVNSPLQCLNLLIELRLELLRRQVIYLWAEDQNSWPHCTLVYSCSHTCCLLLYVRLNVCTSLKYLLNSVSLLPQAWSCADPWKRFQSRPPPVCCLPLKLAAHPSCLWFVSAHDKWSCRNLDSGEQRIWLALTAQPDV